MNRSKGPELSEHWLTEAANAIAEHKIEGGRLEMAIAIAAHLDSAVRTGASGPFALWTRSQILAMSRPELVSNLLLYIDHETIKMHLAGSFVHNLHERQANQARASSPVSSEQIAWTIEFFENADASPDYTFVAASVDQTGYCEEHQTVAARAEYCGVLLDNIVWKRDRWKAA